MASVSEIKAVIEAACGALERDVIPKVMSASQAAHAERNVLVASLNESSQIEIREALQALTATFDELEERGARLLLVVATLRAYADSL